jgi:hypothetical protein
VNSREYNVQTTGGQRERSKAELRIELYNKLFDKYEKRFEGNEFGIPANVLADFYAGWELDVERRKRKN